MRALLLPALTVMLLSAPARPQTAPGAAQPAATAQAAPPTGDSLTAKPKAPGKDSVALQPKSRADSVIVVKHSFNHREQIITGSVIMTCLAVMLVAMNNYNPR